MSHRWRWGAAGIQTEEFNIHLLYSSVASGAWLFYFVWFEYFVVENSLRSLRLKRSPYFVWEVIARPQPGLLPQEKEPPAHVFIFPVTHLANSTANIFKNTGNVKILSRGEKNGWGNRVRFS
jgi:hypothetical protein